MNRRQFTTGGLTLMGTILTPFVANLAKSAPAPTMPRFVHLRATAFGHFDDLADHYAPALRNLTPEQAVRLLYRGMLGVTQPLPRAVDDRVRLWQYHREDGAELTLRWFMRQSAFRHALPHDGRGYVVRDASPEIAAALTRWRQTDILYRTLWNRAPTVKESTETLLAVADLVPMGATKTVILPGRRTSSPWISRSTAHAEMDYYQPTYIATPWGVVDESSYHYLRRELLAHGVPWEATHAVAYAVAAAACSSGSDMSGAMNTVATGLNTGEVTSTVAVGAGVGLVTLGAAVTVAGVSVGLGGAGVGFSLAVALTGVGLIGLGVLVILAFIGPPMGSVAEGSTQPPNGPAQTPQGTVTVGEISVVSIGEGPSSTSDAGGPPGPSGGGGSSADDGSGSE
jgi:hypothetical protein